MDGTVEGFVRIRAGTDGDAERDERDERERPHRCAGKFDVSIASPPRAKGWEKGFRVCEITHRHRT